MYAGKLTEQEIRDNVKPLFYTRMRLGEFDPEDMNPYNKIDMSEVQSAEHRELAVRAAMESFVLLKNNFEYLPLMRTVEKVAVSEELGLFFFTRIPLPLQTFNSPSGTSVLRRS